MRYFELINYIKDLALNIPNVKTFETEFSKLQQENIIYGAIVLQEKDHNKIGDFMNYNFYLSYVDRLNENKSNEEQIVSYAIDNLNSIFYAIRDTESLDCTIDNFVCFRQRFLAECAGVYANFSINVPISQCQDLKFPIPTPSGTLSISANNTYDVSQYATAIVNVPQSGITPSGTKSISANGQYDITQYATAIVNVPQSGITPTGIITFSANGQYDITQYATANVNVPQSGYTEQDLINSFNSGHTSGKTDGIAEQKEKLISTAITANGTFTREDGWNQLTINVPQSGITPTGTKSISANGIYDITNFANVNVEVPFSGVSGTLAISANGSYDVSQYAYVRAEFNYEETFKAVKVKQGSKFVFKEEVVGNYQISPVSKYNFSGITDGTELFKNFESEYTFFTPQINNTTNGTSMFESANIGYLSGEFSAITNATRMFKNSDVKYNTSLYYMQPITATSMFEGAYIEHLDLDFSKITISTDMWKNCHIEYSINPKAINCSMDFSTTYFNRTYDIIKDILECAKLTENSNSKQLLFNHTIIDTGGHIQDLINECEQKGWSIDGLHLN